MLDRGLLVDSLSPALGHEHSGEALLTYYISRFTVHLFFKQRPHQILWRKSVIVFYSDDHVAFIYPKPYGWPVSLSLTFVVLSSCCKVPFLLSNDRSTKFLTSLVGISSRVAWDSFVTLKQRKLDQRMLLKRFSVSIAG